MTNGGLRRKKKPWAGAADLHYPLANSVISKFVPFYINQIYTAENLASFVPRNPSLQQYRYAAESWFSYQLRERSNFEVEIQVHIAAMLRCGISFMKIYWDEPTQAVKFDSVNPMYLVVPPSTVDMGTCDRCCHILEMSEEQYRRHEEYKQGDDFVKRLLGTGNSAGAGVTAYNQHKLSKQGITEPSKRDSIIVWECYHRDGNNGIVVDTISPQCPDEPIRPRFKLPYSHGNFPFVPCVMEFSADKGVYANKGICEMVAPFEASLTKTMNAKSDAMSLYNAPMFATDQDMPNINNIRFGTGVLLPTGVKPVVMPQPPISFDQEVTTMRAIAEYMVSMPDYGLSQRAGSQGSQKPRTATEIQNIGQLMGTNTDLRIKIFRLSMSEVYRQAWSILTEYAHSQLMYEYQQQFKAVPLDALVMDYAIRPSGSADGINRVAQYQKALVRFQNLRGDPFVQQAELRKDLLEIDDPQLVSRMLIDPNMKGQTEAEAAAAENLLLDQGFGGVVAEPTDEHEVHVQIHMDRLQLLANARQNLDENAGNAYTQHMQAHIQLLGQTNPNLAKQLASEFQMAMKQEAEKTAAAEQTLFSGGEL